MLSITTYAFFATMILCAAIQLSLCFLNWKQPIRWQTANIYTTYQHFSDAFSLVCILLAVIGVIIYLHIIAFRHIYINAKVLLIPLLLGVSVYLHIRGIERILHTKTED